ncbi:lactonase family protein [Lacticigenium naphthae]|uniref:lactonase family protein n=1 Tax=Lacticigenium naphthae TaxID=515351 RepID=UPI00040A1701|nr:lactonase family protein [Lacticigenium naphthae]
MKQSIYLGTYTKRESKGVYRITLDTEKKELQDLSLVAEVGSPTYLTFDKSGSILYSVVKVDGEHGGIVSFEKSANGNFNEVDRVIHEGSSPCYVGYDDDRNLLYTANYHKGQVDVYSSDEKGHLSHLDTVKHSGQSTNENQDKPHTHYSDLTPDKKYVIACDLGTDEVYTYKVDSEGKLVEVSRIKVDAGTGPRHITFHPNLSVAYVFGELSSDVIAFHYDSDTGALSPFQTISTIPESHTSFNGGAAIRVTKDGKFLYASNRGHDSLAIYSIDQKTGVLELMEWVSTEGEIPRDFNFDQTENFIIVGHQESDNLTLFERDVVTGKIILLQKDVYAPEAICVAILPE